MPEFDELRLQVSFDDQASAGLGGILRLLKDVQREAGSAKLKEQHDLFGSVLKATGLEARGSAKAFEEMTARMGHLPGRAATLGFASIEASKKLAEFGERVHSMGRFAEEIGSTYANVKNLTEQMGRAGIEGQRAGEIIAQVLRAQTEARTRGLSKMFDELSQRLRRPDMALPLQEQLAKAETDEGAFRVIKKFLDDGAAEIRRLNKDRSEQYVRQQIAAFNRVTLDALGINQEFQHAKNMEELEDKRAKELNEREERIRQTMDKWNETKENLRQIQNEVISKAFEPNTGFARMMENANTMSANILQYLRDIDAGVTGKNIWDYVKPPQWVFQLLELLRGGGGGGGQQQRSPQDPTANIQMFAGGGLSSSGTPRTNNDDLGRYRTFRPSTNIEDHRRATRENKETQSENTKRLKQVNDTIYQLLHPAEGGGGIGGPGPGGAPSGLGRILGGGPGAAAASRTPGVGGAPAGGGTRRLGGPHVGGGAPRRLGGRPSDGGRREPTGGGRTPPPSGPGGGRGDPRNKIALIRAEAIKNGVDPDVAVAVARSEGLTSFLGDRGKSGGAFQLYTGGGLGNVFQKETGLDPLDPKNEDETIRWTLKYVGRTHDWSPWHGAPHAGIGRHQGFDKSPAELEEREKKRTPTKPAEQEKPTTPAKPPTAAKPAAEPPKPEVVPEKKDKAAGGKADGGILLGFKGKDGAWDQGAFEKTAASMGLRPVTVSSWETNKAVAEANQIAQGHNGPIHVYGFSLGAQSAREFVKGQPEGRIGGATTIAPFHDTDLSPLAKLPEYNNYPDSSSWSAPAGKGYKVPGPHLGTQAHVADSLSKKEPTVAQEPTKPSLAAGGPGDPRFSIQDRPGAHGADPRLYEILKESSKWLPDGYRLEVTSGKEGRSKGSPWHPGGIAIDVAIIDKEGHKVANYQNPDSFDLYQSLAHKAREIQLSTHPELSNKFRWGGYFSGQLGKKYGAMDLMHFDLGPTSMMGAGSWEKGLSADAHHQWNTRHAGLPDSPLTGPGKETPMFAADPHKVRTTMDSSHAEKVRSEVEAAGKLKAEVIAPPGTKIHIVGGGAFKQTEVVRKFTLGDVSKAVKGETKTAAAPQGASPL